MIGDSMMQVIMAGFKDHYEDASITSKTFMRLHVGKIMSYLESCLKNLDERQRIVVVISSFHDMMYRTSASYVHNTCFKYTCLRWVKDKNPNEFTNAVEQQGRQLEELLTCLRNTILRLKVLSQVSVMIVTPPPMDLFKSFRMQPLPSECLSPHTLKTTTSPFHNIALVLVEDMQQLHHFVRNLHDRAEIIRKERTSPNRKFLHALSYFDKYLDCLEQDPSLSNVTLSSLADERRDYHMLGITNEDGTMPHANLFGFLKNDWDGFFMSILETIKPLAPVKASRPSFRYLSENSALSACSLEPSFELPQLNISAVLPIVDSSPSVLVLEYPCLTSTVQFREITNLMSNMHTLISSGSLSSEVWRQVTVVIKPYYVVFKPESWDYSCLDLPGLYYYPGIIPRHSHQLLMPSSRYLPSELESVLNAITSIPQSFEKYMALVMVYTRTSFYVLVSNHGKGSQSLTYPLQFSKMCDRCHLLEALREIEDSMYAEYVYIFHTLSGVETKNQAYFSNLKSVVAPKFLRHASYMYDLCRAFKGPPRLLSRPTSRADFVTSRRSPSPTRFDPRSDSPYSAVDLNESLLAIPIPRNRCVAGQLLPPQAFDPPDVDSYQNEFQDLKDEVRRLTNLMMSKFK